MATGNPGNPLYQYSMAGQGAGSGFGQGAYQRAIAAGMTPAQIKQQLESSGLAPGAWVVQQLAKVNPTGTAAQYQNSFSSASSSYDKGKSYVAELQKLTDEFNTKSKGYEDRIFQFQSQIANSRSYVDTTTKERDDWKMQYEQLKEQNSRERAAQEDDQLGRLRTGSTIGGSNANRGSLQSGTAVAAGDARTGERLVTSSGRSSETPGKTRFAAASVAAPTGRFTSRYD